MSEKIGKQPPLKLKSAKINPGYPVVFDMLLIEVRIKIDATMQPSTLFIKKKKLGIQYTTRPNVNKIRSLGANMVTNTR